MAQDYLGNILIFDIRLPPSSYAQIAQVHVSSPTLDVSGSRCRVLPDTCSVP